MNKQDIFQNRNSEQNIQHQITDKDISRFNYLLEIGMNNLNFPIHNIFTVGTHFYVFSFECCILAAKPAPLEQALR